MDFHELFFHILLRDSFLSHIPTLFLKQLTTNITHIWPLQYIWEMY
jgi:hypothetical protein